MAVPMPIDNQQIHAFCVALGHELDAAVAGSGSSASSSTATSTTAAVTAADVLRIQQDHFSTSTAHPDPMDLFAYLVPTLFRPETVANSPGTTTAAATEASLTPDSGLRIITTLGMLDSKKYIRPAIQTLRTFTSFHAKKGRGKETQRNDSTATSDPNLTRDQDREVSQAGSPPTAATAAATAAAAAVLSMPPPQLVHLLVQQTCCSEDVQISDASRSSALDCMRLFSGLRAHLVDALAILWESQLHAMRYGKEKDRRRQASVVAIRAATLWIDWMLEGDTAASIDTGINANANGDTMDARGDQCLVQSSQVCSTNFLAMMNDSSDPLLQISVLDLVEKLAMSAPTLSLHWQDWLLSEPLLNPILQFCGVAPLSSPSSSSANEEQMQTTMIVEEIDPILGGSALCVLSGLCRVLLARSQTEMGAQMETDDDEVEMEMEVGSETGSSPGTHVLDGGVGISRAPLAVSPTRLLSAFSSALHQFAREDSSLQDAEQLSLWDAISSLAAPNTDALRGILDDNVLRNAWLNILPARQSKLKAAQLLSIARAFDPTIISGLHGSASALAAASALATARSEHTQYLQKLYMLILTEQGPRSRIASSTTELILQWAASPIPEIRSACYALLTAFVDTCGVAGAQIVLGSKPVSPDTSQRDDVGSNSSRDTQKSLDMMEWLLLRGHEPTPGCRVAKFELTKVVHRVAGGLLAEPVQRKMELFIGQGPHYSKAQAWDVVAE